MPVSIKMAKDQGLSLNPVKISGLCGRLMCCLKYENDSMLKRITRLWKRSNNTRWQRQSRRVESIKSDCQSSSAWS